MKFNIYDYNNRPLEIDTKGKEIKCITIKVISGDEIIDINYEDGSWQTYDSSTSRIMNFNDDIYRVEKQNLAKWIESGETALSKNVTVSYNREIK